MAEREEHREERAEKHLSPIEMLGKNISWIEGLTVELKRELKVVNAWRGSVQSHGGVMSRKEREVYHLEARLSDLRHLHKSNNEILEGLRNTKTPNPEEQ